jgi:hypothetical protein
MGIDLTVMASQFRERDGEMRPTATLRLDRDMRLFGQLAADAAVPLVRPLPDGLKVGCYEDQGLRFVNTDRYGKTLTYTTPGELRQIVVPEDTAGWNRAALAFLLALPPGTRIVLYWS